MSDKDGNKKGIEGKSSNRKILACCLPIGMLLYVAYILDGRFTQLIPQQYKSIVCCAAVVLLVIGIYNYSFLIGNKKKKK